MAKKTTINKIAADDAVSAVESAVGVSVTGSNDVGAKVVLNGIKATALTSTTWKVVLNPSQIQAFGQGEEILKAVTIDRGGKSSTVTRTIQVDTVAPKAATADKVAQDDIINAAESKAVVWITGHQEDGSQVTLNGKAVTLVSPTSWKIALLPQQIKAFGQGEETLKLLAADRAGNATAGNHTVTIDTIAPTVPTIGKVAGNDIVDAAESHKSVTITGSKEAGSTVTLNGAPTTALTATTWKITLTETQIAAFGPGKEALKAVATDAAGNASSATRDITVDTRSAAALKVETSAGDAVNKVQVTVTSDTSQSQDLLFKGLTNGAVVLDSAGHDVTAGVQGFQKSAIFTLVLPQNADSHFNLSVLPANSAVATANADNTVKIALDNTVKQDNLSFISKDQNMWDTGNNAAWEFHQYIPLIGTETTPWTQNDIPLLDTGVADKFDFGTDALIPFQAAIDAAQAGLDAANSALNDVNGALAWAQSQVDSAQQAVDAAQLTYDNDDFWGQIISGPALWAAQADLGVTQAAYDVAKAIYDAAYPAAVDVVNGAQAALNDAQTQFNAEKDKLNIAYSAAVNLSADLIGKVGLSVDFSADAGSIDTALNYAMTTHNAYNQTTDTLFISPTLVNKTTGDSVAFTTISPNVKFQGTVDYDIGADVTLGANANISALGETLIDGGFTSTQSFEQKGSYNFVNFDSSAYAQPGGSDHPTDPFQVPLIENWTKLTLKVLLDVPTVATQGKETSYDTTYFNEGGLVTVDPSVISDAIWNFLNAKIELNPELAGTINQQSFDAVMTAIWNFVDPTQDGNNYITQKPVFILDASDTDSAALFHINSVPDDLSTLTADTGKLGFYLGYGKSNDFVKVNIDLDQLAALVANLIVFEGVLPPVVINPLDQQIHLDQFLTVADVTGTTAELLNKFVEAKFEIGAVDVDVSENANFSQEFTLSVDDMAYTVTLEDGKKFNFSLNDDQGVSIPSASGHDANHDGVIDYSMKIVPDAMLSNDTMLDFNFGYQLDFLKTVLLVKLGLPQFEMAFPVFSGSLGPLLRVQGSMDQVTFDTYEKRFDINVGSDSVNITGIGYQEGSMFT